MSPTAHPTLFVSNDIVVRADLPMCVVTLACMHWKDSFQGREAGGSARSV